MIEAQNLERKREFGNANGSKRITCLLAPADLFEDRLETRAYYAVARTKETDAFVSGTVDGTKSTTTIRFNTTAPSWNESMSLCASL